MSSEVDKVIIEIKSTIEHLAKDMGLFATNMSEMTKAVSKLAVTDTRVDNLSNDVHLLGDAHRSAMAKKDKEIIALHEKINKHHENHDEPCETNTEKTRESFDNKLMKTIAFIIAVIVFLFQYNHMSISDIEEDKSKALLRIANNESEIKLLKQDQKHAKEISEVKELLKKANGHRYYIKEELKKGGIK